MGLGLVTLGYKTYHGKGLINRYYPRFNYIQRTLCDVAWRTRVQVKNEALAIFLVDPNKDKSTLQLIYILINNWSEDMHACVYVTGVSSMVRTVS